ncbi:MAG: flagellar hook-associated protein FlgK [Clostridiaceae bacterium]|nr:flagellar hook-associated protein FlgK [Clostridiaceae bacterium]
MNNTTFMGLEIALRGLYSSQRGLANVSHNVDNINTPGYARQVINQTAARPLLVASGAGMLGMGSDVVSVDRVRDTYLDEKYWSESKYYGEWLVKATIIEEMQAIYNEPSDTGYTKIISDFFNALQTLSTDPSSEATRAMVMERGKAVAKYFNSVATHFDHMQEDLNNMVYSKVEEINNLADQIRELNLQIYNFEVMGNKANDLRDRRDYLVDKLSRLVNIEAYEVQTGLKLPNGEPETRFMVTISGKALVDHDNVVHLKCEARTTNLNAEDINNLYEVSWEDGNKVNIKSGELKGYLDMRDGNDGMVGLNGEKSPEYKGIPYYQRKMNEFVRVFAMAFNEGIIYNGQTKTYEDGKGHADGYVLYPDTNDTKAPDIGIRFFTMLGEDGKPMSSEAFIALMRGAGKPDGQEIDEFLDISDLTIDQIQAGYAFITARNFSISWDIESDPTNNIAATDTEGEVSNNKNLLEIMKLRHNPYMFMEGTPEDYIKTLVSSMGVDGQQFTLYMEIQENIMIQLENRRLSVSGVSLNEEMINLVKYQQIYGAAAKMIQTYSEVLDVLVNRLGI